MSNKTRPDPIIPDHEVLRKIGGGAYGEVWLARGVTGALRAVKIVWREDFDDARGFEREFEGILKFEPISRDHPGLVNVLHVGRSPDTTSFYYYVMELGDDVTSGQDINPVEYEPRTLRADAKRSGGTRMETNLCIDVGVRLADALDHLHERGLAHRDVKPANVIFVNGKAKLADIGLVAARDQRTFVGTEGFVPPEGPGSAPADVYSLGKVLYEIATGKDRLDFPELPDEPPPPEERKRWLELNRIICDICDPYLSRRKITKASDLSDSLRMLQRGKRRRRTGLAAWVTSLVLGGFIVFGAWEGLKDNAMVKKWFATATTPGPAEVLPPPKPQMGKIRVVSHPDGAEVFIGTTWKGVTVLEDTAPVGSEVEYTLQMAGYKDLKVHDKVPKSAVTEPMILGGELQEFKPPAPNEEWSYKGVSYPAVPPVREGLLPSAVDPPASSDREEHLSTTYITETVWNEYIRKTFGNGKKPIFETLPFTQGGKQEKIVLAKNAVEFCEWLREDAFQANRLKSDDEMIPEFDDQFNDPGLTASARNQGLKPFRVRVRPIRYGTLIVESEPRGASVSVNRGDTSGDTNEPLPIRLRPGPFHLVFTLEGYAPKEYDGIIKPGETLPVNVVLKENKGVRFEKPWENSLGMKLVPVGSEKDLMVCIWETRVADYESYANSDPYKQELKKAGQKPHKAPGFKQTKDHPVVNVSRDSAEKFCAWLTDKEKKEFFIGETTRYRLPTDLEWSRLVGLADSARSSPGARDGMKAEIYSWGTGWPPPPHWGNLSDISWATKSGMDQAHAIPGYNDGFPYTAPVGSFQPTMVGDYRVYDLCGNVQEWVADNYSTAAAAAGHPARGVLRGGGWNSFRQKDLFLGVRNPVDADQAEAFYGFRVVLAKEPIKSENPNDSKTN